MFQGHDAARASDGGGSDSPGGRHVSGCGRGVADPLRLAFLWRPLLPDIDDDVVLETAVNGRADWIVTFNRRDFTPAERLCGIAALLPGDALRRLGEGR